MKTLRVLGSVLTMVLALVLASQVVASEGGDLVSIYAQALETQGRCIEDGCWHFVITSVVDAASCPAELSAVGEGSEGLVEWQIPFEKYTGGTCHYSSGENLDVELLEVSGEIYSQWEGQFNLSCGDPTSITLAGFAAAGSKDLLLVGIVAVVLGVYGLVSFLFKD